MTELTNEEAPIELGQEENDSSLILARGALPEEERGKIEWLSQRIVEKTIDYLNELDRRFDAVWEETQSLPE